jgi:hypothetical protein
MERKDHSCTSSKSKDAPNKFEEHQMLPIKLYILRSTNVLILYERRKKYHTCEESLLYLFIKRVIKLIVVAIKEYGTSLLDTIFTVYLNDL